MTTTSIPSALPEDFTLNVENTDRFVNSASPTFTDRFGNPKKTITGALAEIEDSGVIGFATLALLNADLVHREGIIAYVTNDPAAENNATYRKVGASGVGSWVKSDYDPVNTVTSLGSLLRNQGANFPFRSMVRDGVTSAASSTWNNLILDVRVIGASADCFYQIAYQQNEASIGGDNDFGWVIYEFAKSTFATASVAVLTHNHDDPAPTISRIGGIQTISFQLARKPGTWIDITLDAAKLLASGSPIRSNSPELAAWSWVIDPSRYVLIDALRATDTDSLLINQGASFPLRSMVRDGVTSAASSIWNDLILDVKVWGVEPGLYYQLAYQQNEASIGGDTDFGWIIYEFAAGTFSTASVATLVHNHSNTAPAISRTGGIQTISFPLALRAGAWIDITLDAAKLLPAGSPVRANSPELAAWSWIIDPSRYVIADSVKLAAMDAGKIYYEKDGAGAISVAWASKDHFYRLRFGPNGCNNLPNIIGIDRAALGDITIATWVQINSSTTDWLPPLVVQAASGGDAGPKIYTGGNHGSDGSAGGSQTARNVMYILQADGRPLSGGIASGWVDKITAVVVNEIMAYNTITFPRYVIRQSFVVDILNGSVEAKSEVKALESVTIYTDNGPQMVTTGFNTTELFLDGSTENRIAFDSGLTSGPKSTNPDAWAAVIQSTNGQQVSWMDRVYGIGDGRYVDAGLPLVRGGGGTNTKIYQAAIAAISGTPFASGEAYKWRGGYAWQSPSLAPVGFDSVFAFRKAGESCFAHAISASNYTTLP